MCDMLLARGIAVPRAPALKRFSTGPVSTRARFTVSVSAERLLLFSAFAMALLSVFAMRRADLRGMSVRKSTASRTACGPGSGVGDFAHLARGHARVAGESLNFHV